MSRPLVLWQFTDGKPGHESQTRGLIAALARRTAVDPVRLPITKNSGGWREWLVGRCPVDPALPSPDLILACGSRTHWAALGARRVRGGRCVVLMTPSLPLSWFDLCLIPEHDGVRPRANVVVTRGVLNSIVPAPDRPQRANRGLFLIGGPSSHHGWNEQKLIQQIAAAVDRDPARTWTLTTSRRTPPDFVESLNQFTGDWPHRGRLTVVPCEQTPSGWVADQLGQCSAAFVSEDSVSMIYESLTAGVAVGLLDMPRRGTSRVIEGLERLEREGLVARAADFFQSSRAVAAKPVLGEADRCAAIVLDRFASPLRAAA